MIQNSSNDSPEKNNKEIEESEEFFSEALEQSKIKATIVSQYFYAWAKIISRATVTSKLGYIDLYCGPGTYDDGTESTPLKILRTAISMPSMHERLVTSFNDKERRHVESLTRVVNELEGISKLKHPPKFMETEVEDELAKVFESMKMIPTLVFIDPFGYKGLSVKLLSALFKDWGCDAIFFFNYNRVNMGMNNKFMKQNIDTLFGEKWATELRSKIAAFSKKPTEREHLILETLKEAIKEKGGLYIRPFKFRAGKKTSHYLIYISKHPLGYTIMKEIMSKLCICDPEGIPSYEFDSEKTETVQPSLSDQLSLELIPKYSGIEKLGNALVTEFKGQTLEVKALIEKHHINKDYIEKNYKDALKLLEEKGKIACDPPAEKRRKIKSVLTMADKVKIQFC